MVTGRPRICGSIERRDRFVVGGQLALGDPVVREQDLLRMRDHDASRTTSRAALSVRTPRNREWRSLPCAVHSMNATCTTTSGVTQCARTRGRPTGLGERGFGDLDGIEARAQFQQQFRVEPGADLAGEYEIVLLEISDKQGAQADPPALRIGESADHQLLRRLAFHLQPVGRAAMLVSASRAAWR